MKNPFPENIRHVTILSPASLPDKKKVMSACADLRSMGIKVNLSPNTFMKGVGRKMPADENIRAKDFNSALESKTDLILCSRGGYGSAHLIEKIDWKLLKMRNIPVVGYSDITTLHLAMFAKKAGIPVEGPVATEFSLACRSNFMMNSFADALQNGNPSGEKLFDESSFNLKIHRKGKSSGRILPVNLSLLVSLAGTPYFPDMKDVILLIEDVNEPVYKIDRMLTQLHLCGALRKCSALLFGVFRKCGAESDLHGIFAKFAESVKGPVVSGIPFGHCIPRICARFGAAVSVGPDGRMNYD